MKRIITETARILRSNQTKSERKLWKHLRYRQLGKKFLRQKPIILNSHGMRTFIIADFFCREARLINELDGGAHENKRHYDASRDRMLREFGYTTIRFANEEIEYDIDAVLLKIHDKINDK